MFKIKYWFLVFLFISLLVDSQETISKEDSRYVPDFANQYGKSLEKEPEKVIENIEDLLPSFSHDVDKIWAFYFMSIAFRTKGDFENAFMYVNKGLKLSTEIQSDTLFIRGLKTLAKTYSSTGEIERAVTTAKEGILKASECGMEDSIAYLTELIGMLESKRGNFEESISYYLKTLAYYEKIGDKHSESNVLNNLSTMFMDSADLEKALYYNQKSSLLAEELQENETLILLYVNRFLIYKGMEKKGDYSELLEKALYMSRDTGQKWFEAVVLLTMADMYVWNGDYDKASETAMKAMEISQQINSKRPLYVAMGTYGIAMSFLGKHEKAIETLETVISGLHDIEMPVEVRRFTAELYKAYERKGDYKQALNYFIQYKEMLDEINKNEKQKVVDELEAKYESQQKEKEIQLLSKENELKSFELNQKKSERNVMFLTIMIVVLICILVWQRLMSSKKVNSQLRELNEKLNELSLKDSLTGLYNRRYFSSHIESHVAYIKRKYEDRRDFTGSLGFFLLDIDHFKKINDTTGHSTGDMVLKEFANRLNEILRSSDIVVRWGGEEFLILARDSSEQGARLLVERIINGINTKVFSVENNEFQVTCSIGYILFPFFPDDSDKLSWENSIQLADNALYKAKNEGRNRAYGVMSSCPSKSVDVKSILNDFDKALDSEIITLFKIMG